MSKKGAQIKTLCLFCNKGELHCRCLAGDDEPDYYDVYLSREREFLPDLVTSDDTILDCQSGESNYNTMIMQGSKNTTSENVEFRDQNPAWVHAVESDPDPSFGVADQTDADLGNFFERPLKIFDVDWATTDANFGTVFNPWTLYFENPRVANRISNFNNLRCKLHLKFVINGNGFFYGRTLVSYSPLPTFDNTTPTRAFISQDLIGASQKPHIFLDPCTSMGGEMVLPFFWFHNTLRIPRAEWQQMGSIDLTAFTQLRHANDATDAVRITVFAWTEDMVLSTPTNQNPITLVSQSGEESKTSKKDEYGGSVSGPATALAKVAGMLKSIPPISMYARASEFALSGIAGVASTFGYCRPVVDAPIVPYRPAYMGNMSNTNVPDSTTKLSTDLKQETVIDPRTVGLSGTDEMSIRSIATRESFLTTVDWPTSSIPNDRLCTFGVTPYNWDEFAGGTNLEIHMTPACHVGCLFANWRGTMKYRFQIMASNFHKGRLQIQYDPYDSTENEFNVAYNRIVDISEEKDFTIEVGWGVPNTFCAATNPGISALNFRRDGTTLPFPLLAQDIYNGQLSIWVLNDLTVPNSVVASDVAINVFVSAGDDIEFINPTTTIADLVWFPNPTLQALQAPPEGESKDTFTGISREEFLKPVVESSEETLNPQSGEELAAPDMEETTDPSRPVTGMPDMSVSGPADLTNPLSSICFGETIPSIRNLLKRYSFYAFKVINRNTASAFMATSDRYMDIPLPAGYAPNGVNFDVAGNNYNFVHQTYMGWMSPCYQGFRGGFRYKRDFHSLRAGPTIFGGFATATRSANTAIPPGEGIVNFNLLLNSPSERSSHIENFSPAYSGTIATDLSKNNVLEYELPYQSPYRFQPTRTLEPNAIPAIEYSTGHVIASCVPNIGTSDSAFYNTYVAAADDYSLFFYTNVPVCYYQPSFPSPSTSL
jgi:hypothetical protein